MVKRRRGSRTAPSARSRAIVRSSSSSTGRSRRSRCRSRPRSTRSPSSSRTSRRPTSAARTGCAADDTLYGLYEGVPRTDWGADGVADPGPHRAVPAAARGGLPGPGRPRRRGLADGRARAGPSPGHRRRSAGRARRRLSARQPTGPGDLGDHHAAKRQPASRRSPTPHRAGHRHGSADAVANDRRVVIGARPDMVEADRRVGQADEHHDLRRERDAR